MSWFALKTNRIWLQRLVGVSAVLLCGCTKEAPAPAPKPEETPDALMGELRQAIAPMTSLMAGPEAGFLTDEVRDQVIAALRAARDKYQNTEVGRNALNLISHDIVDLVQRARDSQRYRLALAGIEAFETLNPGSPRLNSLKERLMTAVRRPKVAVKGFFIDKEKDDTYAFLVLTLKPSGKRHNVQVRPGEEFDGLRFIDIVGNNQGVILEYLDIPGSKFKVMVP